MEISSRASSYRSIFLPPTWNLSWYFGIRGGGLACTCPSLLFDSFFRVPGCTASSAPVSSQFNRLRDRGGRQGQTQGIRLRSGSNTELSTETRTVLPLNFLLLRTYFNSPRCLCRASASRVYLGADCLNFSLLCNNLRSRWKVFFLRCGIWLNFYTPFLVYPPGPWPDCICWKIRRNDQR